MCSCSWIRWRDFVPQASNPLLSQASMCCSPSALHKQPQFWQKPTQRWILTGFMPTQGVLTGAEKAVAASQALAIPRWCFHLEHRDGWGGGLGTADQHLTQQLPAQCSYLPAMTFFFFFSGFLALTVLVTAVSQPDIVISITNQNSCCCNCQFVRPQKTWINKLQHV